MKWGGTYCQQSEKVNYVVVVEKKYEKSQKN